MRRLFLRYRAWWYATGHRPAPGSLLYSPSFHLFYLGQAMGNTIQAAVEQAERDAENMRRERDDGVN